MAALTPVTGGPYYGEVLAGICRVLGPLGGRLVAVQTIDAGHLRDEVVGTPEDLPPIGMAVADGVISITTGAPRAHLERLRAAGQPVVLASSTVEGFEAPTASPDNAGGIAAAVTHLLGHGHRRIGFVGSLVQTDLRERHRAYEETLRSHGIEPSSEWSFEASDHGETGGQTAAQALLAAGVPVTALLVATDRNALGLIAELTAAGVGVPGDIAVVGVDGVERGSFSTPTLATVRQDFVAVGTLAAELLLAELAGEPVPHQRHTVPSVLLPRESCGCAAPKDGPPGSAPTGQPLPGAVSTLADVAHGLDAIAAEVASGRPAPAAALKGLAADVGSRHLPADELRAVVDALTDQIATVDTTAPGGRAALIQLSGAVTSRLWQSQAAAYLERATSLEHAVREHYDVGHRLLDGATVDPRQLAWMAGTEVRAACFAAWSGGTVHPRLQVSGTYDPGDALQGLLGQEMAAEDFPPAAMVAGADARRGELSFVIPVRARGKDFGVLAIVGTVDTTASSGREKYNQWAALLATSLEQAELHTAVRESEERYTLAARATNDGLWDWDLKGDTTYFSDRCLELLGTARGDRSDRARTWFDAVHPEDLVVLRDALDAAVSSGGEEPIEVEHRVWTPGVGYRYLLCRAVPVSSPTGVVERLVGSLADIHPRKELEDRLRRSALHDAVTGLPNRTLFQERLSHAIAHARRTQHPRYAVLFIDLDHFKEVNDTLGHAMGDELLAEVGRRLRSGLREVDVASRFGGDEFALLLHDVEPAGVRTAVERVLTRLREPIDLAGHRLTVSASVGVALGAMRHTDGDEVLRDADAAMYEAKASQRGTYRIFDGDGHDVGG